MIFSTIAYADPSKSSQTELEYHQKLKIPTLTPLQFYRNSQAIEYNILDYITFNNPTPSTVKIEYVGLHQLVLSQLEKRISNEATDDLRREYNLTNITDSEFRRKMEFLNRDPPGPNGYWWERPWYDSLPPGKNGAPKELTVYQKGLDFRIPKWFIPYWWIRKQIASLGDIWIGTDTEFSEELGILPHRNDGVVVNKRKAHGKLQKPLPTINIRQRHWFKNSFYHLRFKPSVRFKPSKGMNRIIDEASLRFRIELYSNPGRIHFADLNFYIRHNIPENDTFFSVHFNFITW